MKLVTVLGARPQFIKAAALSALISENQSITEIIIHTGQHYDKNMSDIFFEQMGIPQPNYNLGVSGGGHGQMTGRQLEAIETVLLAEKPNFVVVYGDTNSTLAAALAAAKLHIPVVHIEAGLRSFNKKMPEEINRILTDHVSDFLFTPSKAATKLLAREGIDHSGVICCGDIMYDVALLFGDKAVASSTILDDIGLTGKRFKLATIHRQENTDDPERMAEIFSSLRTLSKDMPLVLPLHPRTRNVLEASGDFSALTEGLTILDPLPFFDITRLLKAAELMVTDSGGMQKEAYYHGTKSIILRDETEWSELVDLGWATIPKSIHESEIINAVAQAEKNQPDTNTLPYGEGNSAEIILATLLAQG